MQVIGQNNDGLDSEWSALAGAMNDARRLSMCSVKSFRRRSSSVTVKKNVPPGTKARMYCGMISGCPNAEGGMRFTFPPYSYKKLGTVSLQNNYMTKITRCKLSAIYPPLK